MRLGAFGSIYLALVWLAAPLVLALWVLAPSAESSETAARYLLAQRVGPLVIALGEGARAASAMIALATGDPRPRVVAHAGVVATTALVGLAVAPGPWIGLLALAALMVRYSAAGFTLSEPPALAAAVATLGFGIATEAGGETVIVVGFALLAALAAFSELFHARRALRK